MIFNFAAQVALEGILAFPEYEFATIPPASATAPGLGQQQVREFVLLTGKPSRNVSIAGSTTEQQQ